MLRIAIQTKGRLHEETMQLLAETGIKLEQSKRLLLIPARNFPIEILFLRDDDIPQSVADGVADIGIVGENEYAEKHKVIATSYPGILRDYLDKQGIRADIHVITGSVEIAPGIGLADAIFDIVSSGSTLVTNHLKEVEVVMQSEAVLIANPHLSEEKLAILDELLFRMEAVQQAEGKKYVLLNLPTVNLDQVIEILPGMKSPTIMPLAKEGWSSLHVVVDEKRFWDIIGKLKALGAESILVMPIEKMIP